MGAIFIGVLYQSAVLKKVKPELVTNPQGYRRYSLPISLFFCLSIMMAQLALALTINRIPVWGMATLSILFAVIAPLAAWFEPVIWRKHTPNQPPQPTRASGPLG